MLQLPNRQKPLSLTVCQLLPATKLPGAEALAVSHPWQASSCLAGQLAAAAAVAAPLEVEECSPFTKTPKNAGATIWITKAVQYCTNSVTDKQWFIPYAFMESCMLSVPETA